MARRVGQARREEDAMHTVGQRVAMGSLVLLVWLGGCAPARGTSPAAQAPAAAAPAAQAPAAPAAQPAAATTAPEPVLLRQARQTGASGIVVWLAEERGWLREEGLTVEQIPFSNA